MQNRFSTVRDLWLRFASGGEITPAEDQTLADAIVSDDDVQKIILQDLKMHQMLNALAVVDHDIDCVDAVLSRCGLQHVNRCSQASEEEPLEVVFKSLDSSQDELRTESSGGEAAIFPDFGMSESFRLGRSKYSRKGRSSGSALRTVMAIVTLTLVFAVGFASGLFVSESSEERVTIDTEVDRQKPRVPGESPAPSNSAKQFGFATLASSEFGVWDQPRINGSRLETGDMLLRDGHARIEFDNGAVLKLVGPAEIRLLSPHEIAVEQGQILAMNPTKNDGLLVTTPTSRLVDHGAEFTLAVDDRGATDVLVHRGNMTMEPMSGTGHRLEPLTLAAARTNRASIYKPATGNVDSPVATAVQSVDGDFSGQITLNGKSMLFASPESFDEVRKSVWGKFSESTDDLKNDWTEIVRIGLADGSLQLNGHTFDFDGVDDIFQLQQKMIAVGDSTGANNGGTFEGMINVNGEVRRFSSPEEFEAVHREVFGPLQGLGINVFDSSKLERMLRDSVSMDGIGEKDSSIKDVPLPTDPFVPSDETTPAPANPFIPKED